MERVRICVDDDQPQGADCTALYSFPVGLGCDRLDRDCRRHVPVFAAGCNLYVFVAKTPATRRDVRGHKEMKSRHVPTAFMGVARLWRSLYTTRDPLGDTAVTAFT